VARRTRGECDGCMSQVRSPTGRVEGEVAVPRTTSASYCFPSRVRKRRVLVTRPSPTRRIRWRRDRGYRAWPTPTLAEEARRQRATTTWEVSPAPVHHHKPGWVPPPQFRAGGLAATIFGRSVGLTRAAAAGSPSPGTRGPRPGRRRIFEQWRALQAHLTPRIWRWRPSPLVGQGLGGVIGPASSVQRWPRRRSRSGVDRTSR